MIGRSLIALMVLVVCAGTVAATDAKPPSDLVQYLDESQRIAEAIELQIAGSTTQPKDILENAPPPPENWATAVAKEGEWSTTKWSGDFIDADANVIAIQIGKVVELTMTSSDLIYEMSFPDLNIKFDAIPGRISVITLQPHAPGRFIGQCSGACGQSDAPLILEFMTPEALQAWRAEREL